MLNRSMKRILTISLRHIGRNEGKTTTGLKTKFRHDAGNDSCSNQLRLRNLALCSEHTTRYGNKALMSSKLGLRHVDLHCHQTAPNLTLTGMLTRVQMTRNYSTESDSSTVVNYQASAMPDKLYRTIELELKSVEPAVMRSYQTFISTAANHLGIEVGRIWSPRKPEYERFCLLKSAFVHGKHKVQYEVRTYFMWIQVHRLTGSTADTFIEYIERMLPEGVALKVTKVSLEPKPLHLTPEEVKNSEVVQAEEMKS